jgi:hypothetical protein
MYVKVFPTACSDSGDLGTARFKVGDRGEMGLWVLRAGTGSIAGNPRAPIPLDPCPLFESREISIVGVLRISMHGVVAGGVFAV